jgi:hypothetical protein
MGCVDNAQSFYIAELKAQPDAPECIVSVGDAFTTAGGLDLSVAVGYNAWFMVTNGLVSKENTANLQAETNGIFIEGAEAYLESSGGQNIGDTEYFDQPVWLEPESSGVANALVVSSAQALLLTEQLGCLRATSDNYPYDSLGSTDVNGQVVGRPLEAVYVNVRFLGQTNGTLDQETPWFKFLITLCCGCYVDWATCGDPCEAFCTSPEPEYCNPGVFGDGLYPCSGVYFDPEMTWEGGCEDSAGTPVLCDCSTCE